MQLKSSIIIIIAIFWIFVFIYRYFLKTRIVYDISIVNNWFIIFIYFFTLILNIITVYFLIQLSLKKTPKEKSFITYFQNVFIKLENILYWKPLNYIFDHFIKSIPGIGDILMSMGSLLNKSFNIFGKYTYISYALILNIIPRCLLIIVFILDVFIQNKFYYLTMYIPIIVPYSIIMQTLLYIFVDFGLHNKTILEEYLLIKPLENGKYLIRLKPNKLHLKNNLNLYVKRYFLFSDMYHYSKLITYARDDIKIVLKPFFSCIYLIGFLKLFLLSINVTFIYDDYLYIILLLGLIFIIVYLKPQRIKRNITLELIKKIYNKKDN